jgi:ABC-type sugar transport system substrate-binding protein
MKRSLAALTLLMSAATGFAQQPRGGGPNEATLNTAWKPPEVGIQWFTSWEAAKAEAAKTGRPILLVSAAPHCAGVSGLW